MIRGALSRQPAATAPMLLAVLLYALWTLFGWLAAVEPRVTPEQRSSTEVPAHA